MRRTIFEGDIFPTKFNGNVVVLRWGDKYDIDVQFVNTGYIRNTDAANLRRGSIKDPYHPCVYGIGFIGEGKHLPSIGQKATPKYSAWINMFVRCYDENALKRRPSYHGCSVSPKWHNFQDFGGWYDDNYINEYQLDKDVLVKGNKVYSPDFCAYVPMDINLLFSPCGHENGLPAGVKKCLGNTKKKLYTATVSIANEKIWLGNYGTPEEAFNAYKIAKEKNIKEVAKKWKGKISDKVYNAMINYVVDIDD